MSSYIFRSFLILALLETGSAFAQGTVTFCATGDVLLDRGCRTMIMRNGPDYLFGAVGDFINLQDLAFCNLEGPMSSRGKRAAKDIDFRADSTFVEVLKRSGFDIFSLANNHMLDYGREALSDTKSILEMNGLETVGAGANRSEALRARIVQRNGITFAFLAFVTVPQVGIKYREELPCPAMGDSSSFGAEIARVRKEADFVIVSFHWGVEYTPRPSKEQTRLAHYCIDHGADLILGHHPHVIQSIEKYRGKFILYSMGNFVFDQHKPIQRESMIFGCTFRDGKIESPYIYPAELPYRTFRPVFPDCASSIRISERVKAISKGFNTVFRDGDTVVYLE